ncbi:hypothetical protein SB772_19040 [Paraburkholderia sp. SIMBA_030]
MNGTNNQPGAGRGGRRPASMVDSQLEHLEGMIQYLTRGDADSAGQRLHREYWEKRIRALEETHDLVAIQRRRIITLLDRLQREAHIAVRRRTVA